MVHEVVTPETLLSQVAIRNDQANVRKQKHREERQKGRKAHPSCLRYEGKRKKKKKMSTNDEAIVIQPDDHKRSYGRGGAGNMRLPSVVAAAQDEPELAKEAGTYSTLEISVTLSPKSQD